MSTSKSQKPKNAKLKPKTVKKLLWLMLSLLMKLALLKHSSKENRLKESNRVPLLLLEMELRKLLRDIFP